MTSWKWRFWMLKYFLYERIIFKLPSRSWWKLKNRRKRSTKSTIHLRPRAFFTRSSRKQRYIWKAPNRPRPSDTERELWAETAESHEDDPFLGCIDIYAGLRCWLRLDSQSQLLMSNEHTKNETLRHAQSADYYFIFLSEFASKSSSSKGSNSKAPSNTNCTIKNRNHQDSRFCCKSAAFRHTTNYKGWRILANGGHSFWDRSFETLRT